MASGKLIELRDHTQKCQFCNLSAQEPLKYGTLYMIDDVVAHYYCVLLSDRMLQNGADDEGMLGFLVNDIKNGLKKVKKSACDYCGKSNASIICSSSKCKAKFHLPCGLDHGSMHQFMGQFLSFCKVHRPKQQIPKLFMEEAATRVNICPICYEPVNISDDEETLWGPCCKQTWYHRYCIVQLAESAGYFFKCPNCNDNRKFKKWMLQYGVFIPEKDASWELEPNAFHELEFRYARCDAEECLCPDGRERNSRNTRWEVVLCETCGSQGIHVHCGHLLGRNSDWECNSCKMVTNSRLLVDDHSDKRIPRSRNHRRPRNVSTSKSVAQNSDAKESGEGSSHISAKETDKNSDDEKTLLDSAKNNEKRKHALESDESKPRKKPKRTSSTRTKDGEKKQEDRSRSRSHSHSRSSIRNRSKSRSRIEKKNIDETSRSSSCSSSSVNRENAKPKVLKKPATEKSNQKKDTDDLVSAASPTEVLYRIKPGPKSFKKSVLEKVIGPSALKKILEVATCDIIDVEEDDEDDDSSDIIELPLPKKNTEVIDLIEDESPSSVSDEKSDEESVDTDKVGTETDKESSEETDVEVVGVETIISLAKTSNTDEKFEGFENSRLVCTKGSVWVIKKEIVEEEEEEKTKTDDLKKTEKFEKEPQEQKPIAMEEKPEDVNFTKPIPVAPPPESNPVPQQIFKPEIVTQNPPVEDLPKLIHRSDKDAVSSLEPVYPPAGEEWIVIRGQIYKMPCKDGKKEPIPVVRPDDSSNNQLSACCSTATALATITPATTSMTIIPTNTIPSCNVQNVANSLHSANVSATRNIVASSVLASGSSATVPYHFTPANAVPTPAHQIPPQAASNTYSRSQFNVSRFNPQMQQSPLPQSTAQYASSYVSSPATTQYTDSFASPSVAAPPYTTHSYSQSVAPPRTTNTNVQSLVAATQNPTSAPLIPAQHTSSSSVSPSATPVRYTANSDGSSSLPYMPQSTTNSLIAPPASYASPSVIQYTMSSQTEPQLSYVTSFVTSSAQPYATNSQTAPQSSQTTFVPSSSQYATNSQTPAQSSYTASFVPSSGTQCATNSQTAAAPSLYAAPFVPSSAPQYATSSSAVPQGSTTSYVPSSASQYSTNSRNPPAVPQGSTTSYVPSSVPQYTVQSHNAPQPSSQVLPSVPQSKSTTTVQQLHADFMPRTRPGPFRPYPPSTSYHTNTPSSLPLNISSDSMREKIREKLGTSPLTSTVITHSSTIVATTAPSVPTLQNFEILGSLKAVSPQKFIVNRPTTPRTHQSARVTPQKTNNPPSNTEFKTPPKSRTQEILEQPTISPQRVSQVPNSELQKKPVEGSRGTLYSTPGSSPLNLKIQDCYSLANVDGPGTTTLLYPNSDVEFVGTVPSPIKGNPPKKPRKSSSNPSTSQSLLSRKSDQSGKSGTKIQKMARPVATVKAMPAKSSSQSADKPKKSFKSNMPLKKRKVPVDDDVVVIDSLKKTSIKKKDQSNLHQKIIEID